jgi:hypothetical protein
MAVGRRPMRVVREDPPTRELAAAAVARREKEKAAAAMKATDAMATAMHAMPRSAMVAAALNVPSARPMVRQHAAVERDPLVRHTQAAPAPPPQPVPAPAPAPAKAPATFDSSMAAIANWKPRGAGEAAGGGAAARGRKDWSAVPGLGDKEVAFASRLEALYLAHAPQKVSQIPAMLARYRGQVRPLDTEELLAAFFPFPREPSGRLQRPHTPTLIRTRGSVDALQEERLLSNELAKYGRSADGGVRWDDAAKKPAAPAARKLPQGCVHLIPTIPTTSVGTCFAIWPERLDVETHMKPGEVAWRPRAERGNRQLHTCRTAVVAQPPATAYDMGMWRVKRWPGSLETNFGVAGG